MTRWEVLDMKPGQVLEDWQEDGVRMLVMRGPSHLCAYIGVPISHPLAGFEYDAIPLRCHGGLTFAREGGQGAGDGWPAGYYWYGWDYGHSGDAADYYYDDDGNRKRGWDWGSKEWTVQQVKDEATYAAWDFAKLMKLAEELTARAAGWRGAKEESKAS